MKRIVARVAVAYVICFSGAAMAQQSRSAATRPSAAEVEKMVAEDYARLSKFNEAIKSAKDPVAIAVEAASQPVGEGRTAVAAMDVLLEHGDDPRAEGTLEEISKTGPWFIGDGDQSLAGKAGLRLRELRARREFNALLKGATTPAARWTRIQAVFGEHPEWLKERFDASPETKVVVGKLVNEAEVTGGDAAVDLVAPTGRMSHGYAKGHGKALLDFANKIGREKAMGYPYFIERLVEGDGKDALPLLREWLRDAKGEEELHEIMEAIALVGVRDDIMAMLDDSRRGVYRYAATMISNRYKDQAAAEAIQKRVDALRAGHADEKDLQYLQAAKRDIVDPNWYAKQRMQKKEAPK